jgi:hypothetical protein
VTPSCPTHGLPLVGGPVHYTCAAGRGHDVPAADLPTREVPATNLIRLPAPTGTPERGAA